MSMLEVKQLGKAYRSYRTEWHRLSRYLGLPARPCQEHWVVREVDFSVEPGQALGIVGQNGAGKSTLLKMITGTLPPSEGQVSLHGRVAAILELGMGFNPELTGRQNAYQGLGLMGFTEKRIAELMPHVELFAEIGEYFDQPIRTYSSGMQVRVAFAVATADRPEILIIDEALSVGDSYFQHKSFDRIRRFNDAGTSLLFVSHNIADVRMLCNRVLLMDHGRVLKDGRPDEVVDYYNAMISDRERQVIQQHRGEDGYVRTRSGSGEVTIEQVRLLKDGDDHPVELVEVGQPVHLAVTLAVHQPVPELVVGFVIKDRLGLPVYGTNTFHTDDVQHDLKPGRNLTLRFVFPMNLGEGTYSVSVALHETDSHVARNYEWQDIALIFRVTNLEHTAFVGSAWLPAEVEVDR